MRGDGASVRRVGTEGIVNAWIVEYLRDVWTPLFRSQRIVVLARTAELAGQFMADKHPAAVVLEIENMRINGYVWDPVDA